jgi:tRNA threonylcarbamoyladenosine biosynthesis protein TsaB
VIILAIRTDKPQAEIYLYKDSKKIAGRKWQAHLKLAESLNLEIEKLLDLLSISYDNLEGIAVYQGPGSFTGLRIGMSVANTLAYGLQIPIVAHSGKNWLEMAINGLLKGRNNKLAIPKYGAPAHITKPKK